MKTTPQAVEEAVETFRDEFALSVGDKASPNDLISWLRTTLTSLHQSAYEEGRKYESKLIRERGDVFEALTPPTTTL